MGSYVYAERDLLCVVNGQVRLSYYRDGFTFEKFEIFLQKESVLSLPLDESQAFYRALRLTFEKAQFRDSVLQMIFKSRAKLFPNQRIGLIRQNREWVFIYRSRYFSFKVTEGESQRLLEDIRNASFASQKMLDLKVKTPTCL